MSDTVTIAYKVVTYSNDVNSVESVTADALALPPKNSQEALQFFKYISSLSYEGSNPQEAGRWIEANFNLTSTSTIIGKAKLTLHAPSDFARMLRIEKF